VAVGKVSDGYEEQKSYAGCTATLALITQTEIYCANAGDSRSVMGSQGKATALSFDHKPTNPTER